MCGRQAEYEISRKIAARAHPTACPPSRSLYTNPRLSVTLAERISEGAEYRCGAFSKVSLILAALMAALVPVWGQKLEVKFASLRAKAREKTGIDLDGSTLTPLPTNSGLISNVIGAIAGK